MDLTFHWNICRGLVVVFVLVVFILESITKVVCVWTVVFMRVGDITHD